MVEEEYISIVQQEENNWFQQAKSKWIVLGDCNTHFFHQSTLVKKRRNKIYALLDPDEDCIYEDSSFTTWYPFFFYIKTCTLALHGRKGFIILKLEIEKAYDRFEWSFIMDSFRLLNIPARLCSIIFHCISSVSVSIIWNGDKTATFNTSRGLRQGYPISPYLFIVALERLSHKINDLVNEGTWNPFKFGRGEGPRSSHVCFVDDLLLFAEDNMNQVLLIKEILEEFCSCSGQKENFSKSKVLFSNNIAKDHVVNLSNVLGFEQTRDLGISLGTPMLSEIFKAVFLFYS